nr:methyltransferase domain-containing protein [arsenite-oxidising bacterium NT-25]
MNLSQRAPDRLLFLRSWISRPLQVAAIAPSSRWLADAITADISAQSGHVLELGAGTGALTRALLRRGVDEEALTLIEREPAFARLLRERFPFASVLECDAAALPSECRDASTAVSGLPLLSMSPAQVERILSGTFERLLGDACFYQFTYGLRCPVPAAILFRLGLTARYCRFVPQNLPPASVHRIMRRSVHEREASQCASF